MNKVVAWRERTSHGFTTNWQDGEPSELDLPLPPGYSIELAYDIPDTHCVVPRLVTDKMVNVAEEAYADWCSDNPDTLVPNVHEVPLRFAIQAMLNAAEAGDE